MYSCAMHYRQLFHALVQPFSVIHVMNELKLKKATAMKLCQRYVRAGILIRLRPDMYVFADKVHKFAFEELLQLSAQIKPNTFISGRTALRYHGVSLSGFAIEAIGSEKSFRVKMGCWTFKFHRFPKKYCFSTVHGALFQVATPEKALLDLLYLKSFGRYKLPLRVRRDLLSRAKMEKLAKVYPKRTQKKVEQFWNRRAFAVSSLKARVRGPVKNGLRHEVLKG